MTEEEIAALPQHIQFNLRVSRIFFPRATEQQIALIDKKKRYVHYTSADAALKIINTKRLWMRNTNCMADYMEVQHGKDILFAYFSDPSQRDQFTAALDSCANGVALRALTLFDKWWHDTRFNTYISSISEHEDDEDLHGRLSMWRAFGGNTARVAIVFRLPFFSETANNLNILFSPVAYLTQKLAHAEIGQVIQNIHANADFIRTLDRQLIENCVFNMLTAAVTCLKHEGFREECEWRVVYSPNRRASPLIESSTETIGGIPQIIYRLPFDKSVSDTVADLDVAQIFDRLIIGPSPYASAIAQAFHAALDKAGVSDAGHKIVFSGIPIRG